MPISTPPEICNGSNATAELGAEAVAGKEFVICKAGKPLVRVSRLAEGLDPVLPRRRLGLLAGPCAVPEDFDH